MKTKMKAKPKSSQGQADHLTQLPMKTFYHAKHLQAACKLLKIDFERIVAYYVVSMARSQGHKARAFKRNGEWRVIVNTEEE